MNWKKIIWIAILLASVWASSASAMQYVCRTGDVSGTPSTTCWWEYTPEEIDQLNADDGGWWGNLVDFLVSLFVEQIAPTEVPDAPDNPERATCRSGFDERKAHATYDAKKYFGTQMMTGGSSPSRDGIVIITYDDGGMQAWYVTGLATDPIGNEASAPVCPTP